MNVHQQDVIATLKNKIPSEKLTRDTINKRVIHSNGAYYYRNNKGVYIILSGLLPSLKRCFWPNVNIDNILKQPSMTETTKMKKKKRKKGKMNKDENKETTKKLKGKGRYFGTILGTKIHTQLHDFIFYSKSQYLKKHSGLHRWTKSILLFIDKEEWYPLFTEYNIYNEELRIGTSIDMICVNKKNGKLVLLEFKTGYKNYFENYDGFMKKSLMTIENSPLNWATMQLIFSIIIIMKQQEKRRHADRLNLSEIEAHVIRIDDDIMDIYPIDIRFIVENTDSIYNDMLKSR